jgi:hypothetical protein
MIMNGFLSALPLGGYNPGFQDGIQQGYGWGPAGPGAFPFAQTTGPQVMNPVASANVQPFRLNSPNVSPVDQRGAGGWMGIQGLGANVNTLKLGIGALGAGAGLWNAFQQNKLAKATFNHQKGLLDTNLANSIKSYNLQLDDKLRSRQVVEGSSDASREEARRRWEARDERRG